MSPKSVRGELPSLLSFVLPLLPSEDESGDASVPVSPLNDSFTGTIQSNG